MEILAAKKLLSSRAFILSAGLVLGSVNAVVDRILHPDIPFFDVEHLIVGGAVFILAVVFLSVIASNYRRLIKAEEALAESEKLYRTVIDACPDEIALFDPAGTIIMCNERSALMHGYADASELVGKNAFSELIDPVGRERAMEDFRKLHATGILRNQEFFSLRKDGSRYPVEGSVALIRDAGGKPKAIVGILRDLTSRKTIEEQIIRQSNELREKNAELSTLYEEMKDLSLHDPLTGLANRRLMEIVLGKCFARCKRFGSRLSAVMMDIDHFKKYNDKHGHAAGDAVLVDAASAMAKEIREVDLAVRYGGEEFLLLLNEADEDGGYKVAEKIRSNIASRCGITASAGVAAYEPWMKDKEDLIAEADRALYRAKETGRDRTLCGKDIASC